MANTASITHRGRQHAVDQQADDGEQDLTADILQPVLPEDARQTSTGPWALQGADILRRQHFPAASRALPAPTSAMP